ncbi:MAG: response regulator [Clostridia bacterium]|nr:response regulator [Clostridia bacterium]
MGISFGELLKRLRSERGLSQSQLGEKLHVDRSTIAKWESGSRVPDAVMFSRLSDQLGISMAELLRSVDMNGEPLNVIMVDDERIILAGGLPILKEALPGSLVSGFTMPSQAVDHAMEFRVDIAFLDIEMGRVSGLDVCRELIEINPRINVIYLTAYREYSFDAWDTGACGFLLKPLTAEKVKESLKHLRYPVYGLGGDARSEANDL